MKYRKKPLEVNAWKFISNLDELQYAAPMWVLKAFLDHRVIIHPAKKICKINTLEGEMTCHDGDYIVQGVDGELYPVKESIFLKTYERVRDEV